MPKKVDEPRKKVEEEEKKAKTFPVGYVRMCLETNLTRSYIWKESRMIKPLNTHQVNLKEKFVTPGEQHEGNFVNSPERKSPWTEPKTIIQISNSNKKEFKEQVTAKGEEMHVKIVTIMEEEIIKLFNEEKTDFKGDSQ